MKEPNDPGSGGGSFNSYTYLGGAGGGVIKLNVSGEASLADSISANGQDYFESYTGGGSGGSVWLSAGTLSGDGAISVNGGKGYYSGTYQGGGGGGGRIALYFTNDQSSVSLQSFGGCQSSSIQNTGGAGTIYKESAAQSGVGDLVVDNNSADTWNDRLIGRTPLNDTLSFDTITIQNYGNLETKTSASITYATLNWSTNGIVTDNGGTFLPSNLTIPAGARLVGNTARTLTGLTVNGTLTHSGNTTPSGTIYKLDYTVNGDFAVGSGGIVSADYKGFTSANGPGAGGSGSNAESGGGGYGGSGGSSFSRAGGAAYGSLSQPADLGSGGGQFGGSYPGGSGGGAVKITVSGATTLSSVENISADGQNYLVTGYQPGGGSGGSIWLSTGTLSGTGSITANGGIGYETSGSGGGGRIAVYYTSDSSSASLQAYGGYNSGRPISTGGAGTIYKESAAQSGAGDLIVDNGGHDSWEDRLMGRTTIDEARAFDSITLQNYGNLGVGTSASITYATLNWSTNGIVTDNGGTFLPSNLTIPAGARLVGNTARTLTGLTVNGTLTHSSNTTPAGTIYKLDYTVNGDLTIGSGGAINADNKGYQSGSGTGTPATQGSGGNGGGGYGGAGGNGSSYAGGTTYGSSTEPADPGSGGGDYTTTNYLAGAGGGAVKLTVSGTMTISSGGTVSADGQDYPQTDFNPGGGSGGSVWIVSGILTGTGEISADGGKGDPNGAGGGGGRIAVYVTTNNAALAAVTVAGGTGYNSGAAGTIYPDLRPTLSTQAASDVTASTATGNGEVDNMGIVGIVEHGHVWSTSAEPVLVPPNILDQWKMNDNAANKTVADAVGIHNGTAVQNTSAITSAGKINSALSFNNSSDYISVGSPSLPTGDFTYSFWAYMNNVDDETFLVASDGSGGNEIQIWNGSGSNLKIAVNNSYVILAPPLTQTATWYHVAITRSGSEVKLYVNGSQSGSTGSEGSALNFSTCPLLLGTDVDTGCTGSLGNWLGGRLDDVRIYSIALSISDVANLYNAGNGTETSASEYSQLGSSGSAGAFDSPLAGLVPSTTYYVRSYAMCSDGSIIYGDVKQFETLSGDPISAVASPQNGKYTLNASTISGTANPVIGSITSVQISIKDATDGSHWWDGDGWDATEETWLNTDNLASWSFNSSAVAWEMSKQYTIRSKAVNSEEYTETPGEGITFTYSDAPPNFKLKGNFKIKGNSTFR